jgi:prepilin-type N-terminal cleavage/methylation domain-containing protein
MIAARRIRAARGFMLVELMVVISLLAVFALVATKVLVLSINVPHEVGKKRDAIVRFDSVVTRLRDDVWTASAIQSPDPRTLEIHSNTGPAITWKIEENGIRRMTPDSPAGQHWSLTEKLQFTAEGPAVTLTVNDDPDTVGKIQMLSQRMLLAEAAR